ncbi:MAG: PTS IIA-like nitrogen regulatory protein PtsN [Gammaproteobacteria bacterium]|jgi:PTS system nitrogen regulatory IIA component
MQIADILPASRVAIDVPALSKKAVLEELARLVAIDTPNLTPAQAFDGLIARERLGSTGLGNGIAIPHGRIAHLPAMQGAFLRTASPIDFDAIDGAPVDLFFALFVPQDTTAEHNATLAELAKLFVDETLVRELREQASAETIHLLLVGQ